MTRWCKSRVARRNIRSVRRALRERLYSLQLLGRPIRRMTSERSALIKRYDTRRKEDPNARKDYTCRRKYLQNTFQRHISSRIDTYQTDASRDGGRKRIEDVDGWAQPLGQSLIALTTLLKFSNSILKDSNNGGSRLARLQLGGERMCEEVFLCLLLVRFERSLKYRLKGRLGGN